MKALVHRSAMALLALATFTSACGAPEDGQDDPAAAGDVVPAEAVPPARLVDVHGRTVTKLEPDKLRLLVKGLRADGRAKDAEKLLSIFSDAGDLRDPSAYGQDELRGQEAPTTQAIYLDDRSVSYSVTIPTPKTCNWTWCGWVPCQVCTNPAYDTTTPFVTAGTGEAGDPLSNKTILDVNFRQNAALTPSSAPRPPAFDFWVQKADGSIQGFDHIGGGTVTNTIGSRGGKITMLMLRMEPGNPWFGYFGGDLVNRSGGLFEYTSESIGSVSSSAGFDSFFMNFYWLN